MKLCQKINFDIYVIIMDVGIESSSSSSINLIIYVSSLRYHISFICVVWYYYKNRYVNSHQIPEIFSLLCSVVAFVVVGYGNWPVSTQQPTTKIRRIFFIVIVCSLLIVCSSFQKFPDSSNAHSTASCADKLYLQVSSSAHFF